MPRRGKVLINNATFGQCTERKADPRPIMSAITTSPWNDIVPRSGRGLATDLAWPSRNNELEVHYQVADLGADQPDSAVFEALLRWNQPVGRRFQSRPAEFISLAEVKTGP